MLRSDLLLGLLCVFSLSGCSMFEQDGPSLEPEPRFEDGTRPGYLEEGPFAASALPDRLRLGAGRLRLPGSTLNTRGAVRSLVFPVSFGERLPAWSDSVIAYDLIGSAESAVHGSPRGVAGILARESRGLFRLDASVFPYLVAANVDPASLARDALGEGPLYRLARQVVGHWSNRVNLAAFDNDGPDGRPMSGDDDSRLDHVLFVVETDSLPALAHVRTDLEVDVGLHGQFEARVDPVQVMALPRAYSLSESRAAALSLVLSAMGLNRDEMFFPLGLGARTETSSLARVRLGWLPAEWAGRSGYYRLSDGAALVVPIVDVPDNRGLWIVERDGEQAYLTRVAREADGHFATVEVRKVFVGEQDMIVPLTHTEGARGPRFRLDWPSGGRLEMHVSLTATATADDEARRGGRLQ